MPEHDGPVDDRAVGRQVEIPGLRRVVSVGQATPLGALERIHSRSSVSPTRA